MVAGWLGDLVVFLDGMVVGLVDGWVADAMVGGWLGGCVDGILVF